MINTLYLQQTNVMHDIRKALQNIVDKVERDSSTQFVTLAFSTWNYMRRWVNRNLHASISSWRAWAASLNLPISSIQSEGLNLANVFMALLETLHANHKTLLQMSCWS